jgi:NADH:ubiquinone oxidoreductase subunit 3 (subunit A)
VDKASSLVLLLATLAATITYQAGLNPPGGFWPDNGDGHMAGDPILLMTNPRRFKAFFYCNSIAFVASLVAIILVQNKPLLETHVLEATMILDLFGLIGAYAAGSCRYVSTSIYAMALAGAVLVYVVIHVVFFTLHHTDNISTTEIALVEKRRKRLLLFAVLVATITYQAGLTPPGGFRLQGDGSSSHHAGDPVLLHNSPHRYMAFFYCNSVSFMLSIALIILLVNRHLYRPAIRSYALAICTAAGMFGLMGAYAAGSTQHLRTSIYILVLAAAILVLIAGLFLFLGKDKNGNKAIQPLPKNEDEEKKNHAKRKYLMLVAILVASVTYQAGLSPPGGAWQSDNGWYSAGNPIMHDNRRPRYLAFFYSNSTSFVASIVVIILLLPQRLNKEGWFKVMNMTIFLDLLALLAAYAAGSNRGVKTSMYVVALTAAVLAYVTIHIMLAFSCPHSAVIPQHVMGGQGDAPQPQEQVNGGNQA